MVKNKIITGSIIRGAAVLFIALAAVLMGFDLYVGISGSSTLTSDISMLPYNRCGLLMGTSKYRPEGGVNPWFVNRVDAAAELFHAGKIDFIIATGDNSDKRYNEPRAMLGELVERGVPGDRVFLDYAGFRTLDSIIRAREIFGQRSITVISQKFHNERAVYIGRHFNMDIAGYNAPDSADSGWFKVRSREVFARFRAFIDIHVTGEQPRFLGVKINVD